MNPGADSFHYSYQTNFTQNYQTGRYHCAYQQSAIGWRRSFTAEPESARWQEYPFYLKAVGDKAFATGINLLIVHRYAHQPHPTAVPGMTMGPWGIHFDRTNTWWNKSKDWLDYLSRCQYLLRQGRFVADLVYFSGDDANMYTKVEPEDLDPKPVKGYDYDLMNAEVVMKHLSISNNQLVLPNGMNYRVFVLQRFKAIPLALLKKIRSLVYEGMILVERNPSDPQGCRILQMKMLSSCISLMNSGAKNLSDKNRARAESFGPIVAINSSDFKR